MKILLNGKASLEAVFAEIDINAFREAQRAPERIPPTIKALIAMPDFPEKLVDMIQKAAA